MLKADELPLRMSAETDMAMEGKLKAPGGDWW